MAPFSFGQRTGTDEYWIRTCPEIPVPGYYPTELGWEDPFELMQIAKKKAIGDNIQTPIMNIISQESVEPKWSGALIPDYENGSATIEGVGGRGDEFMIGKNREKLPDNVKESVLQLYRKALKHIGLVKIEWVYDGKRAWCVQLHRAMSSEIEASTIVSENSDVKYIEFRTEKGLNELRKLIESIKNQPLGIKLIGDVGITSHFGDLLRKSKIPSKIQMTKD